MKAICFVDDQEDERNRAEKFLGERFTFGTGSTLDEALKDLESKGASKPDLFLMDMYFPEGAGVASSALVAWLGK
ncbi:response regulator [candidate division KSB1 bacterium]|nr:response regulator [candidate division KSB1 bacterium]